MAETSFEVLYDGPAVASGEMAVRELAPALLALGELFTEASVLIHPDRDPVALNIRATRQGSFALQLVLDAGTWSQVIDFLTGDALTAVLNLRDVVLLGGGGGWSVFKLIKWLGGRRIADRQASSEPGQVRLTLEDGTVIEGVPADVVTLYDSVTIRDKAREVVEPLRSNGIEHFEARAEGRPPFTVDRDELESFSADIDPEPDRELDEQILRDVLLTIMKPSFSDRRWRLTAGADSEAFWAEVTDEAFLRRVVAGESFQAGDRLRADLRMVQSETPGGRLKIDRYIDRVTEHTRQLRLDDEPAA